MSIVTKQSVSLKAAATSTRLPLRASATKKQVVSKPAELVAGASAAMAFAMAHPAVTFAWGNTAFIPEGTVPTVTPSLKAFFYSVFWGGVVLAVIFSAVIFVANFDPIRKIEE